MVHQFRQAACGFTTDSGSNIVKALEEDMNVLRLACAGHTLNLAVQKALQISQVSTLLARCRKLVSHFHKSCADSDEFGYCLMMLPSSSLFMMSQLAGIPHTT